MPPEPDNSVPDFAAENAAGNIAVETGEAFLSVENAWVACIDGWMEYQSNFGTGPDERIRAAHLVTFYAHQLALMAATLFFTRGQVPNLDPTKLRVGFLPCDAREGMASGARRFQFIASDIADPTGLHDGLVSSLTPAINAVSARSGMSSGSLWRLASDGIAGAFLEAGRVHADEERAVQVALMLVEKRGSPFRSGAKRFERVLGAHGLVRIYRIRSGCCLIYKTDGGRHCDVCVLLPHEERLRRLAALCT